MMVKLRFFGALILSIQLSSCPEPDRMAWVYDYSGTKTEALKNCKLALEDLGYDIDVYAPESHLLVTARKPLKHYMRRYDYSVIVSISDRVYIYVSAEVFNFKRGSQWSLFGKDMIEVESEDKLPAKLQEKIIHPLNARLINSGLAEFSNN